MLRELGKWIMMVIILTAIPLYAAGELRLSWDPVSGPVDKYTIYVGLSPGVYDVLQIDVVTPGTPELPFVVPVPDGGPYFFVASASNIAGESPRTPEMSTWARATILDVGIPTPLPGSPLTHRLQIRGTNLSPGISAIIERVIVDAVRQIGPSLIEVDITVPLDATAGPADVTVLNPVAGQVGPGIGPTAVGAYAIVPIPVPNMMTGFRIH